ncbi:MAG: hypothetical protein BGO01_02955 [Armatimonadetes bacterium 55-13]|nr:VanZ family protein [Armatimonadota bacterium]OJU63618.1 MAG: hypothetical protein BGO01_02955 [Armatimonadetes bacterium 55-13]
MKRSPFIVPLAWATVIFITSCFYVNNRTFARNVAGHLPTHVTEASVNHFWDHWWWVFVKGWHVSEFAILYILLRVALARIQVKNATPVAFVGTAIYAALDEYHQTFVRARGGRVSDVAIDVIGVCTAAIIYEWATRRRLRMRS